VADGPRLGLFFMCSSCSCSSSFSIHFCFRVLVGRRFGQSAAEARIIRGQADSPRPPRGQSVFPRVATGGSVGFFGQSAAQSGQSAVRVRIVRRIWPDSPRGPCGQSAPPGRTVRQCLAALFLGSIPPSFLSCFRVCFKESLLRL
jgi:hypothetical protein